jgi:dTDP-4-dehydrorhamnose reductase
VTSCERRVLITGGGGRLAKALARAVWPEGWRAIALGRAELDITDPDAVVGQIRTQRPALIINAAAFTGVDMAETEREAALAVNATGAGTLAEAAARAGAGFIHVSTDFVFDGKRGRPYVEDDTTAPLNTYGDTKLAGERLVLERHPKALVLRTAWLLGGEGGFIDAILRRAARGESLQVVSDQTGSPTDVNDLAQAIVVAGERVTLEPTLQRRYHLAGCEAATWHQIADAAVTAWAGRNALAPVPVEAIATADWPCAAIRPSDSRLDSRAFARDLGVALPSWRDRVVDWVAERGDCRR